MRKDEQLVNRLFYTLWTGRSAAEFATSLWLMTWIALLYKTTGSALLAGSITFVRSLSVLASGVSLPYWYQRWTLRKVASRFQHLQSVLSLLFALLALFVYDDPVLLSLLALLCAAMTGYAGGCAHAAANAMYPRIVEQAHWVRSNNLITTGTQMISLLGWTLGGLWIAKIGEIGVLHLCVILLLVSSLLQVLIPSTSVLGEEKPVERAPKAWWSSWHVLFSHPRIRIITMMDIIEGIAGGIWIGAITLVFVKEVLQQSEAWWGYINAAYYVGTLIGGVLLMPLSKWIERKLLGSIILGSFCFSLLVLLYAWNVKPYWALILVVCMGPCFQLRDIAQRTYMQQLVPLYDQPQLFAAQQSLSTLLFGLSIAFSAAVADLWGAKMVYWFGGFMLMLSSLFGLWLKYQSSKTVIEHTEPFT